MIGRFRKTKFGNAKTVVDGLTFDSAGEARRWCELKLLERAGAIRGLDRQVTVDLAVNGVKVCALRPDFAFFEGERRVYEDFKGFQTPDWRIKWKLAKALMPNVEWRISGKTK